MSRPHIKIDELKGMSEHISYEVEMFEMSADKLRRGGLNQYENNVALENLVLHARCLYDFIFPPKNSQPDDAIADDYFDDPTIFQAALPQALQLSTFLKRRTGKEIAHLTYGRLNVTLETKPWNFVELQKEMNSAILVFFSHLSAEQKTWFPSIVS